MANEPDGSIIVDTEIDTQGFKAGTSKLKTAVTGLVKSLKSIKDFRLQFNTSSAKADIERLQGEMSQLRQEIASLENSSGSPQFSTDEARIQIDALKAKLKETKAEFLTLTSQLEEAEASSSRAGQVFSSLGIGLSSIRENISTSVNSLINLSGAGRAVANALSNIHPVLGSIGGLMTTAGAGAVTLTGEIAKLIGKGLLKLGQMGAKVAVNGLKKLGSGIKNTISHFKNLRSSSKSTEGVISRLGKKITGLGSMLKRMVLRKILQGVIQGVKDGVNNLAQYSDEVNGNLSTLKSGLTQLKNSLATAFAPILNVITPILAKLISYLSEAITKVGQFFAALTGKSTFTKAVAVQEDYAASLDKSSKSTSKATKASKKYGDSLDLDEVHDIQKVSDNDKDSSGSGVSPADMFTEVPIESQIADFAKRLKKAIKDGDFAGAGAMLGNGLNSIVKSINEKISWENVGPKVTHFVNGLTTAFNSLVSTINWTLIGDTFAQGVNSIINTIDLFATGINWQNLTASIAKGLNGFISGVNWSNLGKTIGDLINVPIDAAYGFVTTFKWDELGTSLAEGFTSMINTIKWDEAAETLSDGLIGILDTITSFLAGVNWQDVGNKVAEFIRGIKWGELVSALVKGIGAALGGLASLRWGLIKDAWDDVVDWWNETAYEDGEFTIEGLLSGIWEKIKNIGTWIYNNIFKPFIEGFEKTFKIKSPSKVMEDEGGFIIKGLLNGVLNKFPKLKECVSSVKNAFSKLSTLKDKALTWGKDLCANMANGIKEKTASVKNAVSGVASKIKSLLGFSEPEEGPLSNFHTYMPDMLKLMADGINGNKSIALKAVSNIAEDISDRLKNGDYTLDSIGLDSKSDTVLNDFSDKLINEFNELFSVLKSIADSVTFTIPRAAYAITPYGSDTAYSSRNNITDISKEVIDIVREFISSIRFNDDNRDGQNFVIEGDVYLDKDKAGRILAKPVAKEIKRGKLDVN